MPSFTVFPEPGDKVADIDVLCRADHSAMEHFEHFDQLQVCAWTAAHLRKRQF